MVSALELLKIPGVIDRLRCSGGDKARIKETIDLILEMTQTSRNQGLLALKSYCDKTNNILLKNGLLLIMDGIDPEYVYLLLSTSIVSDSCVGSDLLENLIVLDGILSIQRGNHPEKIKVLLNSWLNGIYNWS